MNMIYYLRKFALSIAIKTNQKRSECHNNMTYSNIAIL